MSSGLISGLGQHSSKEISLRWPAVGDIVYDLTDLGNKPRTFRAESEDITFPPHCNAALLRVIAAAGESVIDI